MTREMKPHSFKVPVPVAGAYAGMFFDVGALADFSASVLAANGIQFFSTGAVEARGMLKQRGR